MAGVSVHVPARLSVPAGRLRTGRWRRWVFAVLAFNIALGMGFSVVALRHQADARAQTDVLLANLDAAASAQEATLWHAVAYGQSNDQLRAAARRVEQASGATAADRDATLTAALTTYRHAANEVQTAMIHGRDDQARITIAGTLAPAAQVLHAAIAAAAQKHRAANTSAGRIADGETLFMMVFAALIAGLLFRRFEAARRSGEEGVAKAQARFRALVHHSSDVLTVTDAALVIGYQTPSITRLLGYSVEELAGTVFTELVHPEDRLALLTAHDEAVRGTRADAVSEVRLRHRDGSWRHVQSIHTNLLADADVRAVVVTTRDVTAQKQLEAQLQHNAFHDDLTGLANRALFTDRLEHALARTDRGRRAAHGRGRPAPPRAPPRRHHRPARR